jgi:hypothetical protein
MYTWIALLYGSHMTSEVGKPLYEERMEVSMLSLGVIVTE